jgi:uncharacterized sulfatase
VLIVGDDVGWPDFGFMGSETALTPNLDTLAAQGVVFTHAFSTASSCRPALQSLLTGLHPIQFETKLALLWKQGTRFGPYGEILHFETLPERLAERGYVSFQGGKHWEGTYEMAGFTHGMTARFGAEVDWGNSLQRISGADGLTLGRETMQPLWDFIEEHDDEPFFVWFAPMLPHVPFDAPERYVRLYAEKDLPPLAKRYYANLTRLDDRVGELLSDLERRGLRRNTLVIYISDNGWDQGAGLLELSAGRGDSRGKFSIYELGFRTPLVISWPGVLPEGARYEHLVSSVDVFSTILDFAGAEQAEGRPGSSLHPLLTGTGDFARAKVIGGVRFPDSEALAWEQRRSGEPKHPDAYFFRNRTWRYVWYRESGREELYRIGEDPFETRNLVGRYPEEARVFRREIIGWAKEVKRFFHEEAGKRHLERIRKQIEKQKEAARRR